MVTIEYCQKGSAISDFALEEFFDRVVADIKAKREVYWPVPSEIAIRRLRVGIAEGVISPNDITFRFEGKTVEVDRWGRVFNWPKGFCEATQDYLDRLLERKP